MIFCDYFPRAEDLSYLVTGRPNWDSGGRLYCELNNACWLSVSSCVFKTCRELLPPTPFCPTEHAVLEQTWEWISRMSVDSLRGRLGLPNGFLVPVKKSSSSFLPKVCRIPRNLAQTLLHIITASYSCLFQGRAMVCYVSRQTFILIIGCHALGCIMYQLNIAVGRYSC